jgi:hypothetical protein
VKNDVDVLYVEIKYAVMIYNSRRFDVNILGMKTVGNGRKTPQPFSTFIFEHENESEYGKVGHENERELTEYQEFRKRTHSSEIMSNTVGIRKFNTEY